MRCLAILSGLILGVVVNSVGAGADAPVVFWASDPVRPDEVVVVQGGRWGKQPTVKLSWLKDGDLTADAQSQARNAETLAPLQSSAEALKFLVPASWKPGVYRFTINADGAQSMPVMLNVPYPWWQQGDAGKEASPGGWLRILGQCLSFEGQARVELRRQGHKLTLLPKPQDCWSLNVELPIDLSAGEYEVLVHNGYGGTAGWKEAGKISIAPHQPVWKAEPFDVTRFGAVPNDGLDDTYAVQRALDAAGQNGGGTVYFPRGRFQMNDSLRLPRFVLLKGAGAELTQLYWRDPKEPLEALIYATNSFGVEDLTIMAANHRYGILADKGDKPEAGNVTLQRVRLRLNQFLQRRENEAAERYPSAPWEHAICLGGENVRITDCEVFSSLSPFGLFDLRKSVIRNNRFTQDRVSSVLSGTDILFEDNQILGGSAARGGTYVLSRKNLYYARNKVGPIPLSDAEAFTTDGNWVNYVGKATAIHDTKLTLTADTRSQNYVKTEPGVGVFIMAGAGAGQWRELASCEGRQMEIDRPWAVPPDENSVIHIAPLFSRYLVIDNAISDAGIGIQSYFTAADWVVAGNRVSSTGGIHSIVRVDAPNWHVQFLGNEIAVGNSYCDPHNNMQPPGDGHLGILGYAGGVFGGQSYPVARCSVFRHNVLQNNASIVLSPQVVKVEDVVVDHNTVRHADTGISVSGPVTGVVLWRNQFDDVRRPLKGSLDNVFMHPAQRALGQLAASDGAPSAFGTSFPPEWDAAVSRLKELAKQDPLTPGLEGAVRQCIAEMAQAASRSPLNGNYSMDFLRALLGIDWICQYHDPEALRTSRGGTVAGWLTVALPACSPSVKLSLRFPVRAECQVGNVEQLALKPGKGGYRPVPIAVQPNLWGAMCRMPTHWEVEGGGWKLRGKGSINIGDPWSGVIGHWAICGPFPNSKKNAVDNAVYGPERRLDLTEKYDTLRGKRGWDLVETDNTGTVDFANRFGPQRAAVAYAVAVLRARKPIAVSLEFQGTPMEIYVNQKHYLLAAHCKQASMTLNEGDNVVFIKVANFENAWSLRVMGSVVAGAEPGDVQIVPAGKLFSTAALHPPAKPPIPEGPSLPFSERLDWKLVYEDDFDRTRLGTDWLSQGNNQWVLKDGTITSGKAMWWYLTYARKVSPPLRVEYDVKALSEHGWARMTAATLTPANEVAGRTLWHTPSGSGYMLCLGWHNRQTNEIWREAEEVQVRNAPPIEPGKWHHVVAQFVPPKCTMILDGKMVLAYVDKKWLSNLDTFSFFTLAGPVHIDNVRIYTADPKARKQNTNGGGSER